MGDVSHRLRWISRLIITGVALTTALAVVLLAGAADPPIAPREIYNANSALSYPPVDQDGLTWVTLSLDDVEAPFTLQAEATFSDVGRFWGFWLSGTDYAKPLEFLIHPEGSYSFSADPLPDWHPFIHIRPERNHLYLHVEQNGAVTLRINQELVSRFDTGIVGEWQAGIVFDSSLPPIWHSIQLNGS